MSEEKDKKDFLNNSQEQSQEFCIGDYIIKKNG